MVRYRAYGTKNEPKNYTTKTGSLSPWIRIFVPQNKVTKMFKISFQNYFKV